MKILQFNLVIFLMTLTVSAIAQHNYDNQGVIYSNNGNVGIGTNAPNSLFHLNDWGELLRLSSPDNSIGMTTSLLTTPNGNSNNEIVNRILFQALPDNISSVNRVFHFRGHHGSIFTPLFEIESTHDGNIMRLSSNTNSASRKLVEVDNQDGSVFVIKGDGKIGIGKLPGSSSSWLDVQGTINSDIGYHINGSRVLTVQNNNTFIGISSGRSVSTATRNTFVGDESGKDVDSGSENVFMGFRSGLRNTSGSYNTFIGRSSGSNNTVGQQNTFLGTYAGLTNMEGNSNTFIGYNAGRENLGRSNTFLGSGAGNNNTTGIENVFLGSQTGQNNISGSHNIFIGNKAGLHETSSNKLYIENSTSATPLIYGEFDQDKVGINTTNLVGDYSLFVRDGIITEKVVVEIEGEWPDYVFNPTYQLPSLTEVSNYIQEHQHLPEIPSATEIAAEGLNLGEMEALMMKKIEELTLYAIEQETEKEALKGEVKGLKDSNKDLKQKNQVLTERLDKLEEMMEALMNK